MNQIDAAFMCVGHRNHRIQLVNREARLDAVRHIQAPSAASQADFRVGVSFRIGKH